MMQVPVSKTKPNTCPKINPGAVVTIVASVAIGFALSRFTAPSPASDRAVVSPEVEELLKSHELLRRCTPGSDELRFLKKGGEYFVDYKNPRTFNDKIGYILQNYFLKSPVTAHIGNKYLAKKYVAEAVGEDHVVKLFEARDNPADIDWNALPKRFVLKVVRGHFGKQVIPVKDKSKLDIAAVVRKLEEFCKTPAMGPITGKRILAEEYLEPSDGTKAVTDYKFFCTHGKVLFAYCLSVDSADTCDVDDKNFSFYSVPEWKRLPITLAGHRQNMIPRPKHFNRMIALAEKLSKPFPLIRVDLYEVGDRVLVGELTEDSGGAKNVLSPLIWDFKLGEMIPVPSLEELEKIIENDRKKYGKDGGVAR
jgi:hypothetical protein